MKKIAVINGPNINLVGIRQPKLYGNDSLNDINTALSQRFPDIEFSFFQSNHEGAIIDEIHRIGFDPDLVGIVLNAGAYTHTSLAIGDAVAAVNVPVIEVHLTNIYARESIRHQSLLSALCAGVIAGFGPKVYAIAVEALLMGL